MATHTPCPPRPPARLLLKAAGLTSSHIHPHPEGLLHLDTPVTWIAALCTGFCFKGNFFLLEAQAKPRERAGKEGKIRFLDLMTQGLREP